MKLAIEELFYLALFGMIGLLTGLLMAATNISVR